MIAKPQKGRRKDLVDGYKGVKQYDGVSNVKFLRPDWPILNP